MKKLCIGCRHCKTDAVSVFAKCVSPNNTRSTDLVSGEIRNRWLYCSSHRTDNWFDSLMLGTCGAKGTWWEAKIDD